MKKIILSLIIASSIAFNVAVLVRYFSEKKIIKDNRPIEFCEPKNKEMFLKNRKLMEELQRNLRENERELGDYLSSEDYDEEEARKLIDKLIESKVEIEKQIGENILQMRRNQSCEEARRFFKRMRHPRHPKIPRNRK